MRAEKEKNGIFFSIIALIFFVPLGNLQPAKAESTVREIRFSGSQKEKENTKIKQIKVLGSTAFSQEELNAVTKEFIGSEAIMPNFLAIREAITQLYVDKGYTTSGAFIPNRQDISDGVVRVQIIEGELEQLEIQGLSRLSVHYVRSRLATQTPININKLQKSLQLLLQNPLIESLNANLASGSSPGLSILSVKIKEADSFSISATFDNARSPAVGSHQGIARISEGNLLGLGDQGDFIYSHTEGSDTFNFSYQVPINAKNGTIRAAYATSSSEIVEEPFNELDIQSESRSYELSYRQPLLLTPTEEFALGLTASRIESESSLLGTRFPLSRGSDEEGRTRISVVRLFQEYTYRDVEEVFSARAQISLGIGAFGALSEDEPDSQFLSWQAQAQYGRLLAPDTLLIVRGELQLADQELLVDEQFRLGGTGSVRGYRQDLLLGDNGLFVGAEVRVPILRIPKWETVVQVAPFFDVGKVWSSNGNNPIPSNLASLGLGLLLSGGDNFSAGLYWGIPLVKVDEQGDSLQEDGISFFVEGQIRF
jgi:hemolysin activation/secretion protein